jgi:hypothetical protein
LLGSHFASCIHCLNKVSTPATVFLHPYGHHNPTFDGVAAARRHQLAAYPQIGEI